MSDKFTWIVAEGIEYDTEYDGRMYTVCGYCDAQRWNCGARRVSAAVPHE